MEVRPHDQSVRGVPVKISEGLSWKAFTNTKPGINGCWESLYTAVGRRFRIRSAGKYYNQLLVLWWCIYGKGPSGQLSNACGDTSCVNPSHYRDQDDRNQQAWKVWDLEDVDDKLLDWGIDGEDGFSYGVHTLHTTSYDESADAAGMTRMFNCYHCNAMFDPMKSRNPVVCDDCWTDEDQAQSEEVE